MNNKKITIIIPIYNTPHFALERMFLSLYNQTNKNFYIIALDDGSTESCAKDIEAIVEKNKSIIETKIIHKQNTGVSDTRNVGIKMVDTEYIAFCDADDEYKNHFIQTMYEKIEEYPNVDIVYSNFQTEPVVYGIEKEKIKQDVYFQGKNEIKQVREAIVIKHNIQNPKYVLSNAPVASIYKTDIVKQVLFDTNIHYFEDYIFNRKCINKANSIAFSNTLNYIYYQNDFSAMHKKFVRNPYELTKPFWSELHKLNLTEEYIDKKYLTFIEFREVLTVIGNPYFTNGKILFNKKKIDEIKEILNNDMSVYAINNLDPHLSALQKQDKIYYFCIKHKLYRSLLIIKKLVKNIKSKWIK